MQFARYKRYLVILLTSLALVSCASPKYSQELQGGKVTFQSGDYRRAFRELLPVAARGRPEAQYAVGYMYYYGLGVPEDCESGLFWIESAAEQGYMPAIKALCRIHRENVPYSTYPAAPPVNGPVYKGDELPPQPRPPIVQRTDPILQTLPEQQKPIIAPVVHPPRPVKPFKPISAGPVSEVETTAPTNYYTLQLFGSYHLDSVKEVQDQLRLKNTGHVYKTVHEGKTWYVLTFGNFPMADEAAATRYNLPNELKQLHPWVRKVDDMTLVTASYGSQELNTSTAV